MTNQEAIKVLKVYWPDERYSDLQEALALAIGLLKTGARNV